MRRPNWSTATRARTVVLALIAIWAAWLTWSLGDSTTTAEQATERAATAEDRLDRLADEIAHACEQGGEAAAKLGAACISADQAKQQPPTAPRDGADGRGITSTNIRAGRLVVTYSDGTTTDVGPVTGAPGQPGPQGRGIVATTVDEGDLVVVFSDGARESLGRIVGRDGADGANGTDGADGRGIANVATDGGRLLITYADGTSEDAGPLPAGPQGEQGPRGERGPQGEPGPACPDGYTLREVLLVATDGGAYDGVACVEATDTNSNDSTPNTPR